jgi:hypothetical protein
MRTLFKRAIAIPAVVLLITAGLVAATATAAQAYPSNCQEITTTAGDGTELGIAWCNSGTGPRLTARRR